MKSIQTIDCLQRKFEIQNDLEDWIIDINGEPLEPMNKNLFERLSISIDPDDIPIQKKTEPITLEKAKEIQGGK